MANIVGKELNADESTIDVFRFSFEIIIGSLIKASLILILGWILNILDLTIIFLLSYIPVRMIGGGVHLSTYNRCLYIGAFIILLTVKLSSLISYPITGLYVLWILIAIIYVFVACKYIPSRSSDRKVYSSKKKKKAKTKSLLLLMIYVLVNIYFIKSDMKPHSLSSLLAISLSIFFISPIGYKFINFIDHILSIVKGGN